MFGIQRVCATFILCGWQVLPSANAGVLYCGTSTCNTFSASAQATGYISDPIEGFVPINVLADPITGPNGATPTEGVTVNNKDNIGVTTKEIVNYYPITPSVSASLAYSVVHAAGASSAFPFSNSATASFSYSVTVGTTNKSLINELVPVTLTGVAQLNVVGLTANFGNFLGADVFSASATNQVSVSVTSKGDTVNIQVPPGGDPSTTLSSDKCGSGLVSCTRLYPFSYTALVKPGDHINVSLTSVVAIQSDLGIIFSSANYVGPTSATASIDPYAYIDPTFADVKDFSVVLSSGVGNLPAVPEPSTIYLLASGLAALSVAASRHARRSKN